MRRAGKSARPGATQSRDASGKGSPTTIELIGKLIGADRLLDLLLDNVSDLIVVLDREGRRIYNSPSYRGVLGDPGALKGTDAFAEIHPEDRSQIQEMFQQTLRTGK